MTDYLLEKHVNEKEFHLSLKELDNTEEEAAKKVLIDRAKTIKSKDLKGNVLRVRLMTKLVDNLTLFNSDTYRLK